MNIAFQIFGYCFSFQAFNIAKRKAEVKKDIDYVVLKSLQRRGKTDFTPAELEILAERPARVKEIDVLKGSSFNSDSGALPLPFRKGQ